MGQLDQLELWMGAECTQNRVGDRYFDQLDRTGHSGRLDDIDRLARLGAKALRFPVLWERTAPDEVHRCDWRWSDDRLSRIREAGMRPIIGLVHHGSGPRYTDLLDAKFPAQLAAYARQVAERYPWVTDYTPINEPLTTARFSALYGHWYPHARDDNSFIRGLLNECRATVLAMRAVRDVAPQARLVQTDDLGYTSATPRLQYQAKFENERRWLAFDLLRGTVDEQHPLWKYLTKEAMIAAEEILWFAENPCPPDIIGLNYYISSERFLHEKIFLYPSKLRGGNDRDQYVDTETARVRTDGTVGLTTLLKQAWERFHTPLAITECHMGCTREEQLRWVVEIWGTCEAVRQCGVDVRACTVWSAFGAYDWNSLVTRDSGHYEPGVFDVRAPRPRATALAEIVRTLAEGKRPEHPLLAVPGWWRRPERLHHGFSVLDSGAVIPARAMECVCEAGVRPLAVFGARTPVGRTVLEHCRMRGIPTVTLDEERGNALLQIVQESQAWAAVCARHDGADEPVPVDDLNGPHFYSAAVAEACSSLHLPLLTFSAHRVFDGSKRAAYTESDLPDAGSHRENALLRSDSLIIRTGPLFGPTLESGFLHDALSALSHEREFTAESHATITPTYIPDLVHHALDLLIDGERGVWHLANVGTVSWFDWAILAAEMFGISTSSLVASSAETSQHALCSERGWLMPTLHDALERFTAQCATRYRSAVIPAAA